MLTRNLELQAGVNTITLAYETGDEGNINIDVLSIGENPDICSPGEVEDGYTAIYDGTLASLQEGWRMAGPGGFGRQEDCSIRGAGGMGLLWYDQELGEKYTPYVIEPAAGVGRTMLAFLLDAYTEDEAPNAKGKMEKRTVLRLDHRIAPVKVAVLPLSRNPELSPKAKGLAQALRQHWNIEFDDAGAIGRRYRRQDEAGTPYCITVDGQTLTDNTVTVRDRDTLEQWRVPVERVVDEIKQRVS